MKRCVYYMVSILLAAGSLLAACSEIDAQKNEMTVEPGRTYTLSVVAVKNAPSTKALYFDENSQTLTATWENDDKIEVWADGVYITKILAKIVDETASRTEFVSTESLSSEQANALVNANSVILKYHTPDYDKQDGTLDGIAANCDYAEAEVKVTGIENGNITTTEAKFEGKQAIVRFKILNQNEEALDVENMTVTYGTGSTLKSFTFTLADAASIFFVAIPEGTEVDLQATAAGRTYSYDKVLTNGAKLANGGFYPIKVHMEGQPVLGDPYYSDGTWATCNKHADGAQVVGIVVYLGSGAIVENYPHGLVMALKDASQSAKWDTKIVEERLNVFSDKVTSTALSLVNYGGKAKTDAMAAGENSTYEAAKAAKGYNVQIASNKCTGWFLPSSGQWLSVVYGLCGADYPDKSLGTWWKNGNTSGDKLLWGDDKLSDIAKVLYPADANGYAHSILNAAMKAVSKDYDAIITKKGNYWISYWTSSENARTFAIRMNFGVEDDTNAGRYSSIKTDSKDKGMQYRVRAFLAF